jgi:polysaccharide biosynthesis/export protein
LKRLYDRRLKLPLGAVAKESSRFLFMISASLLLSAVAFAQAGQGTALPALSASASNAQPATTQKPDTTDAKGHDNSYIIGNDDVLSINVWKETEISRSVPVRSDGKISLPLVGEVQAAGSTPLKLEHDISAKLKSYIAEPEVTVIVQQVNSQKFNILGLVNRPGSYPIANTATILDAIAIAGGFRDFAKQKAIYLLRQNADGSQKRISFNYKDVVKGKNPEQNIKLQPRDTIVVP